MSRRPRKGIKSVFTTVVKEWEKALLSQYDGVHHRVFLSQSIGGLYQVAFRTAADTGLQFGFMHMPENLLGDTLWWPVGERTPGASLLVFSEQELDGWSSVGPLQNRKAPLAHETWFAWVGEKGCFFLVSRKVRRVRKSPIFSDEEWEIYLSFSPDAVEVALEKTLPLFADSKVMNTTIRESLQLLKKRRKALEKSVLPDHPIHTGLTLTENMDHWIRRRQYEQRWDMALHRVQDAVAWELKSERLLQSIGITFRALFEYDYIDIHIFHKVGKRYEAFLSWRKNYTGFSDDQFTLLLTERLVSDVLRVRHPRMLKLNHPDGLMNPQLAKLANLEEGLIIPLINGNNIMGMITMCYRKPTFFNSDDLRRISQIARVVAKSIDASNAHTRVHRMATVDGLTNVYNRRFFNDQIKKELARSKRYNHTLSLIMIDIDNFKHFNDTNGHLVGDKVLKIFAELLKHSVRDDDLVARYGGEEFVVVLPYSDVKKGAVVAEKIRREVLLTPFPAGEKQPLGKFSISLGVADTSKGVERPRDLISMADQALYKAKEQGRNQTAIYTHELDS